MRYIGYDDKIAKNFFFRRFNSIKKICSQYNNEIERVENFYKLRIDLWGEFTIDRLVPEMFKALGELIQVENITFIYINAKSIKEGISDELLKFTPNVKYIKIDITDKNTDIPSSITNLSSFRVTI